MPTETAEKAHNRIGRYVQISQKWMAGVAAHGHSHTQSQETLLALQQQLRDANHEIRSLRSMQQEQHQQQYRRGSVDHAAEVEALRAQLQQLQNSGADKSFSRQEREEQLLSALDEVEKSKQTIAMLRYEKQQEVERAMEAQRLLGESKDRERQLRAQVQQVQKQQGQQHQSSYQQYSRESQSRGMDDEFTVVHDGASNPFD